MAWPELSIEDFPPLRDDEPSSLRQDIIDELSDHFACALNRELLKNPDEQIAKQRVISQFGDPIKIARQLWLDAMKEKIMSQRIMTGISAVMAVCSLAVVGIAWMLMKDSQGVNQKMLEQLAVIADRPQADSTVVKSLQKTNEAIVRELRILSESQKPSQRMDTMMMSGFEEMSGGEMMGGGSGMEANPGPPANINQQILKQLEQLNEKQASDSGSSTEGMNQISFQLVQDNKGKQPAVNFEGTLTTRGNQTDSFSLDAVSNAAGILDFGNLPWGRYQLSLNAPWGESFHQFVSVIPGRNYTHTIICPSAAPELISVKYDVHWEELLETGDWYLLADFRGLRPIENSLDSEIYFSSERLIQDENWITEQDPQKGIVLVGRDNRVTILPLTPEGKFKDLDPGVMLKEKVISVPAGRYTLPVINLIHKEDLKQLSRLNDYARYAVLTAEQNITGISTYYDPDLGNLMVSRKNTVIINPFETMYYEGIERLEHAIKLSGTKVSDLKGIQLRKMLRFDAVKDEGNVWHIEIPQIRFTK